jgi:hypothetical protein
LLNVSQQMEDSFPWELYLKANSSMKRHSLRLILRYHTFQDCSLT